MKICFCLISYFHCDSIYTFTYINIIVFLQSFEIIQLEDDRIEADYDSYSAFTEDYVN